MKFSEPYIENVSVERGSDGTQAPLYRHIKLSMDDRQTNQKHWELKNQIHNSLFFSDKLFRQLPLSDSDYEQGRERERQIIDLGHTPDYQSRHKLVGFENPHMDDFENPNTSERARDATERYEDEWEASQ